MKKYINIIAKVGFIYSILKLLGVDFLEDFDSNESNQISNSNSTESIWLDTDSDGFNDTELRDINGDGVLGTLEQEIEDRNNKLMGLK